VPAPCKICVHEKRAEIDRALASSALTRKQIARDFDVSSNAIYRHERYHLSPKLVDAALKRDAAHGTRLLNRITRMVEMLEDLAQRASESGVAQNLLATARELRPYHELLGRVSGEIASAQIQALFVNLGVRDEIDLRAKVDLARAAENPTLEECREEAIALLRFCFSERPEWRTGVLAALESHAEVAPSGNGGIDTAPAHLPLSTPNGEVT